MTHSEAHPDRECPHCQAVLTWCQECGAYHHHIAPSDPDAPQGLGNTTLAIYEHYNQIGINPDNGKVICLRDKRSYALDPAWGPHT